MPESVISFSHLIKVQSLFCQLAYYELVSSSSICMHVTRRLGVKLLSYINLITTTLCQCVENLEHVQIHEQFSAALQYLLAWEPLENLRFLLNITSIQNQPSQFFTHIHEINDRSSSVLEPMLKCVGCEGWRWGVACSNFHNSSPEVLIVGNKRLFWARVFRFMFIYVYTRENIS